MLMHSAVGSVLESYVCNGAIGLSSHELMEPARHRIYFVKTLSAISPSVTVVVVVVFAVVAWRIDLA